MASPPDPFREIERRLIEQADRYRAYLLGQLRELLTGYGQIDVLWFDGQWERPADWWRPEAIAALARQLQPGILLNDRLPGQGASFTLELPAALSSMPRPARQADLAGSALPEMASHELERSSGSCLW